MSALLGQKHYHENAAANLDAQIGSYQREIQRLRNENARLAADIGMCKREIKKHEDFVSDSEVLVSRISRKADSFNTDISAKRSRANSVGGYSSNVKFAKGFAANMTEKLTGQKYRSARSNIDGGLQYVRAEIKRRMNLIAGLKSDKARMERSIENNEARIAQLNGQIASAAAARDSHRRSAANLQAQINSMAASAS
jgi:chromosome segregation ATPase